MLSPEVLESIPLAILTGLGAYGGFPRPPYWWARLSRFRVMQFITLWILIYQGGGKEQTLLNYHLIKNNVVPKILNPSWNLLAIHKKEMFRHNWQLNEDDTPLFVKYGNIWHFTGFPVTDRIRVMEQVWEKYKGKYE